MRLGTVRAILMGFPMDTEVRLSLRPEDHGLPRLMHTTTILGLLQMHLYDLSKSNEIVKLFGCDEIVLHDREVLRPRHGGPVAHRYLELEAWPDIKNS
jgi:hypothetical protein